MCACVTIEQVPTALPIARRDYPDVVFRNRVGANAAMLNEVERLHKDGRPVLIGTTNVQMSDRTAKELEERGVPCQVCFLACQCLTNPRRQSGSSGSLTPFIPVMVIYRPANLS